MTAPLCPTTGKHMYPDWSTAVRYALRSSRRTGRPMRIYTCPDCGRCHLAKRVGWTERRAA